MNDDIGPDEPEPEPYVPSLLEAELFPDDVAAWAASVIPGSATVKPLAVPGREGFPLIDIPRTCAQVRVRDVDHRGTSALAGNLGVRRGRLCLGT